ncbi:hypothetical protein CEXT_745611 [Caerostris extrusa]|uniref:Uncharacterized protein n=1 Tax=Caerostris extrusa TaxID=172846 RepID=A0AAV4MGX7_CAEEX|nr:hypothetical protein CEXT_745611 [Caerostris extrusa]
MLPEHTKRPAAGTRVGIQGRESSYATIWCKRGSSSHTIKADPPDLIELPPSPGLSKMRLQLKYTRGKVLWTSC